MSQARASLAPPRRPSLWWRRLPRRFLAAGRLVKHASAGRTCGAPRSRVPAVIVLVSDDGREYVATAGTRRPNADERFRIGSVTKTFTAAIVLQLAEDGRLRLGDTLARYLPGVVPQGEEMTIRRLLNHRSGLANVTDCTLWRSLSTRGNRPVDQAELDRRAAPP